MKRFPPIAIALLLFAGGWGQALAAAFCPRVLGGHACCIKGGTSHNHDHASPREAVPMHGMADMEAAPASSTMSAEGDFNSLGRPAEKCGHCMGHSRLPATPLAAGSAEQSKQGVDLAAPPTAEAVAQLASMSKPLVAPRQHAPPGASSSR